MRSEFLKPWLVLAVAALVALLSVPAVQAENKRSAVFGASGNIGVLIVDEIENQQFKRQRITVTNY